MGNQAVDMSAAAMPACFVDFIVVSMSVRGRHAGRGNADIPGRVVGRQRAVERAHQVLRDVAYKRGAGHGSDACAVVNEVLQRATGRAVPRCAHLVSEDTQTPQFAPAGDIQQDGRIGVVRRGVVLEAVVVRDVHAAQS